MQLNSLVFPAPKPSYTAELLSNELIWLPSTNYPDVSQRKPAVSLENADFFSESSQKYASRSYESGSFLRNARNSQGNTQKNVSYIPCLLLESQFNSNPELIVLFFHGNGEDIFLAYELIEAIRNTLKVNHIFLLFFLIISCIFLGKSLEFWLRSTLPMGFTARCRRLRSKYSVIARKYTVI